MRPNIELQIEELVLHGFASADRDRIGEAVEGELVRLLTEGGLASSLHSEGQLPNLCADAIPLSPASTPHELGQRIARALYGGIGP